jgi:hypothetical protein
MEQESFHSPSARRLAQRGSWPDHQPVAWRSGGLHHAVKLGDAGVKITHVPTMTMTGIAAAAKIAVIPRLAWA